MQTYAKQQFAQLTTTRFEGEGRRNAVTHQLPVTKIWYGAIATAIPGQLELLVFTNLPGEADLCHLVTGIRFWASEVRAWICGLDLVPSLAWHKLFGLRSALFALTVPAITEGTALNIGHIEAVIARIVAGETFDHINHDELTLKAVAQIKQHQSSGQITAIVGCHRLKNLDDALTSLVEPFLYIS